jgi:hypothetical protein
MTSTALRAFDLATPESLARLRAAMLAAGVTAESPGELDPEGERLARLERQD